MNEKASGYDSDCGYSMPSSLIVLLSTVKSMQASARVNHDVVVAVHINKYAASQNGIVSKLNTEYLLQHISMPLFNLHLEFPGVTIPLSSVLDGFEFRFMGLGGRNANLDFLAVLLDKVPMADFQK